MKSAALLAVLSAVVPCAWASQPLARRIASSAVRFAPSWQAPGRPLYLQRLGALDWSKPHNLSRAQAAAAAVRDMAAQGYPLPDLETEEGMSRLMQAAALRAERKALAFISEARRGVPIEQAAARAEEAERLLLETGPYLSERSAGYLAEARKNYMEAEARRKAAEAEEAVAAAQAAWTPEGSSEIDAVLAEENGGYEGWLEPPAGFEGKPEPAQPLPESFEHAASFDEIKALARERMDIGEAAQKGDWKAFERHAGAALSRLETQVRGELKAIKKDGHLGPVQRQGIESARARVQELTQLVHVQAGPSEGARVMAIRRGHALMARINILEESLRRVEVLARLKAAEAWEKAKNPSGLSRVLAYYRGHLARAGRAGDEALAEASQAVRDGSNPIPPVSEALSAAEALLLGLVTAGGLLSFWRRWSLSRLVAALKAVQAAVAR